MKKKKHSGKWGSSGELPHCEIELGRKMKRPNAERQTTIRIIILSLIENFLCFANQSVRVLINSFARNKNAFRDALGPKQNSPSPNNGKLHPCSIRVWPSDVLCPLPLLLLLLILPLLISHSVAHGRAALEPERSGQTNLILFAQDRWDDSWTTLPLASTKTFSAPEQGSLARQITDDYRFDTLEQIESVSLTKASAIDGPWSAWYWPFNEGALASRYADPAFPRKKSWQEIESALLSTLGQTQVDMMSPAEKYDRLIGDSNFTLTRAMIKNARFQLKSGAIEPWIGYCTGAAAASVSYPRPRHSVRLMAADGQTQIEFRPDDIKALGALLWSTGLFPFKTGGRTCPEDTVRFDPITDRALDVSCREVNPATFHLSLVNQIGLQGRSLLIDADNGREVWNHAVRSYSYTYFNPMTNSEAPLSKSIVSRREFSQDRRAAYRASNASWIVGIELKLIFVYVREPDQRAVDSPEWDVVREPIYRYDLELDAAGKIIGGEWHSRHRPDVLWLPVQGAAPSTSGDAMLDQNKSQWNPPAPIPKEWLTPGMEGSKRSQPLRRVVEKLFALANS